MTRSFLLVVLLVGCKPGGEPSPYQPLALAQATLGDTLNLEATVPPQCYTVTGDQSNPCWTCHTVGRGTNALSDWELQQAYAFSDFALTNRWTNLQVGRAAAVADTSPESVTAYVRDDNYTPLREALVGLPVPLGYLPDLDLHGSSERGGFDALGFARDGSGWRAMRYKPFPGTFWPTNGSADDVYVRLPPAFRRDAAGVPSLPVYRANLAILEAAIAAAPGAHPDALDRLVELTDEAVVQTDIDGNGRIDGIVTRIHALPAHYAGGAAAELVVAGSHPRGTEYLHTVRYLDPDSPTGAAVRLKELRYARKAQALDAWATLRAYEREANEKEEGLLPLFRGDPFVGLLNDFGWQFQGWIEDAEGRLRLQTTEEHLHCMGCHSATGVTIDSTFAMARKVPGADGWRVQDLHGMPDVPQAGHLDPEVLTYLRRVGGGDELRANDEIRERYFPGGVLDEAAVRAAPDIAALLLPSDQRAFELNAAWWALVREQSYTLGRVALMEPAENVHVRVDNGETELGAAGSTFSDGRLQLDW